MKQIGQSEIEKACEIIDALDDDGIEKICEKHVSKQPYLFDYILSASVEYNNPELEGIIIYYFCLFMEICLSSNEQSKIIKEQEIIDFEEDFLTIIKEYFNSENIELLEEYTDQPELIQFMIIEISTPDDDGTQLDDETAIQLFISSIATIKLLFNFN